MTLISHVMLLLDWQSGGSIFSLAKKKKKMTGGYLIARFKSGMNIAYALG